MNWPEVRDEVLLSPDVIPQGNILQAKGSVFETDPPITGLFASVDLFCCDPLIKLGSHWAGLDKVDHFLGHGYVYLNKVWGDLDPKTLDPKVRSQLEAKGLRKILQVGRLREGGLWGRIGNGVTSFGDMASNYQGYFFWRDLLDSEKPIIECKKDTFILAGGVDIMKYVDDSWDEAYNCNEYITDEVEAAVDANIRKRMNGRTCPIDVEKCKALVEKYHPVVAKGILHPRCLSAGKDKARPEDQYPDFSRPSMPANESSE